MNCCACNKIINKEDGGVRVLLYTLCSVDCFRYYYTTEKLRQLYNRI